MAVYTGRVYHRGDNKQKITETDEQGNVTTYTDYTKARGTFREVKGATDDVLFASIFGLYARKPLSASTSNNLKNLIELYPKDSEDEEDVKSKSRDVAMDNADLRTVDEKEFLIKATSDEYLSNRINYTKMALWFIKNRSSEVKTKLSNLDPTLRIEDFNNIQLEIFLAYYLGSMSKEDALKTIKQYGNNPKNAFEDIFRRNLINKKYKKKINIHGSEIYLNFRIAKIDFNDKDIVLKLTMDNLDHYSTFAGLDKAIGGMFKGNSQALFASQKALKSQIDAFKKALKEALINMKIENMIVNYKVSGQLNANQARNASQDCEFAVEDKISDYVSKVRRKLNEIQPEDFNEDKFIDLQPQIVYFNFLKDVGLPISNFKLNSENFNKFAPLADKYVDNSITSAEVFEVLNDFFTDKFQEIFKEWFEPNGNSNEGFATLALEQLAEEKGNELRVLDDSQRDYLKSLARYQAEKSMANYLDKLLNEPLKAMIDDFKQTNRYHDNQILAEIKKALIGQIDAYLADAQASLTKQIDVEFSKKFNAFLEARTEELNLPEETVVQLVQQYQSQKHDILLNEFKDTAGLNITNLQMQLTIFTNNIVARDFENFLEKATYSKPATREEIEQRFYPIALETIDQIAEAWGAKKFGAREQNLGQQFLDSKLEEWVSYILGSEPTKDNLVEVVTNFANSTSKKEANEFFKAHFEKKDDLDAKDTTLETFKQEITKGVEKAVYKELGKKDYDKLTKTLITSVGKNTEIESAVEDVVASNIKDGLFESFKDSDETLLAYVKAVAPMLEPLVNVAVDFVSFATQVKNAVNDSVAQKLVDEASGTYNDWLVKVNKANFEDTKKYYNDRLSTEEYVEKLG